MRIKTGSPLAPTLFGFGSDAAFLSITGIASDSREVLPGDLFLALPGEKTDGAAYLEEAFARGAAYVLSHQPNVDPRVLTVPDPLSTLSRAASRYADRIPHKTLAITGSYGKTTLRVALTSVLSSAFPVVCTEGNGNTDLAVALTLLSMAPGTTYLIAELGMRGPGEISRLSRLTKPDLSVVTAIGSAHVGRLGSVDAIRKAKCEIADGMKPDGTLFYPASDPLLTQAVMALPVRARGVSVDPTVPGTYTVTEVTRENGKAVVSFAGPEGSLDRVVLPYSDTPILTAAAFCFAVCERCGVDRTITRKGLERLPSPPLRRQSETVSGVTLILDCYNASPEPTATALDDLKEYAERGCHLFLVLGDMLELGDQAVEQHRSIGRQAAGLSPSRLICVGETAHEYGVGANEAGLSKQNVETFSQDELPALAAFLRKQTQPGDVVLIKGSRALALERLFPLFKQADV